MQVEIRALQENQSLLGIGCNWSHFVKINSRFSW